MCIRDRFSTEDPEDDMYFEEYEEDLKETVLDQVNAFQEMHNFFNQLDSQRSQEIVNSLSEDKKHSLKVILEFVSQN